ncbi:flagellar biosynthetic protein FliO, partial [Variovorax paradoxus]|uniref:flagellar biosynthetic protein FliO n=2 Tax=Comamonadaceae TaxID=80864 RepID=UPI001ABCA7AF
AGGSASRLLSAVAVGPQQRVVTVEVGPEGARTWLVLGVTGQSITCLHTLPAASSEVPHAQLPR